MHVAVILRGGKMALFTGEHQPIAGSVNCASMLSSHPGPPACANRNAISRFSEINAIAYQRSRLRDDLSLVADD
jgi:hypothetical protein